MEEAGGNCYKNSLCTLMGESRLSHAFFLLLLVIDQDISCEGSVSRPACLPAQECVYQKQMPNVTLRQSLAEK